MRAEHWLWFAGGVVVGWLVLPMAMSFVGTKMGH